MSAVAQPEIRWKACPAAQRPRAAIAAMLVIALAGGVTWMSFGIAWGIGSAVLLVASLNRFFFPSRFSIDERGITGRFPLRTQRLAWVDIRRFVTDERGGYLSTRAQASRMDAYRGMHVLFSTDREQIEQTIRKHIARARAAEAESGAISSGIASISVAGGQS